MSYAPQPSYYHLYPSFYHEHCIYSHRDVETTTTPTIAQSEPPDDEANSSTADSASLPFSSSTSPAVELSETGSITDLPPFDLSLAESVLQITVDDGVPTPSYDEVLAYAVLRSERAVQSSESLHFTFYWSRKEQMAFAPLVHLFGTDWDQIADVIGTKCTIMVHNHFIRCATKSVCPLAGADTMGMDLVVMAKAADERKRRSPDLALPYTKPALS